MPGRALFDEEDWLHLKEILDDVNLRNDYVSDEKNSCQIYKYYGEVFDRWSGKMEPKWNMNPDRYDGITKAQMKGLITRKRKQHGIPGVFGCPDMDSLNETGGLEETEDFSQSFDEKPEYDKDFDPGSSFKKKKKRKSESPLEDPNKPKIKKLRIRGSALAALLSQESEESQLKVELAKKKLQTEKILQQKLEAETKLAEENLQLLVEEKERKEEECKKRMHILQLIQNKIEDGHFSPQDLGALKQVTESFSS